MAGVMQLSRVEVRILPNGIKGRGRGKEKDQVSKMRNVLKT